MPKDYSYRPLRRAFSFLYIAPPFPSFFVLHRHVIAPSWLKIEGLYLSKNLLRGVIYVAAPHHGYGAQMVFFEIKVVTNPEARRYIGICTLAVAVAARNKSLFSILSL